ncbi:MAG: hypothetical protein ACFFCZ_18425 [Promethearchaeota archaeon]
MSGPGPPFIFPPPEDEPKHDLMEVVREVHNTKQSAEYDGLTITPQMASSFIGVYVQLSVEDRLKLLSLSTQEIFDFVHKWATINHPGTAHATDRGDIYD